MLISLLPSADSQGVPAKLGLKICEGAGDAMQAVSNAANT